MHLSGRLALLRFWEPQADLFPNVQEDLQNEIALILEEQEARLSPRYRPPVCREIRVEIEDFKSLADLANIDLEEYDA